MSFELVFEKQHLGVGRRKRATARVFLVPGTGRLTINQMAGDRYLQYNATYLKSLWAPLETVQLATQFDIVARVQGGGLTSQTTAIQLGVARQLCQLNPTHRLPLKVEGWLTCDARRKERKKYGLRKARKAPQYSKR